MPIVFCVFVPKKKQLEKIKQKRKHFLTCGTILQSLGLATEDANYCTVVIAER